MKQADELSYESKLDTITHYLLETFPGDAILSTRANDGSHILTICSSDLENAKALHIPKSFLYADHPIADEIPMLFNQLKILTVLGERGQVTLSQRVSDARCESYWRVRSISLASQTATS